MSGNQAAAWSADKGVPMSENARPHRSCFDEMSCIPPKPPFIVSPLADLMINPGGVTQAGEITLQLCDSCDSSLQKGKLPRLAIANLDVSGSVPPEMKNWSRKCYVYRNRRLRSCHLPALSVV